MHGRLLIWRLGATGGSRACVNSVILSQLPHIVCACSAATSCTQEHCTQGSNPWLPVGVPQRLLLCSI
jgi:hypothetical protein